ncbi:hypothetical protein [Roseateles chitinivorans]|uniref:hypothetical protein n=1 Tax=Roseateles chitinivorans TaxID=2917965 RepID=UPI003D6677A3
MTSIWKFGRAVAAPLIVGLLSSCGVAMAAEGDTGPVLLDNVGVLEVAGGGHLAGNMEIKIRGGFTLPTGMTCSNEYITTLRTTDANQRMFTLLTIAQVKGRAVRLRITDDPALRAFSGRCSLMWVQLEP